jgi:hypothetical protein
MLRPADGIGRLDREQMKEMIQTLWNDPASARKAIATLIGVVLMLAAAGLLPDLVWVQWIVAALTAVTTFKVRNDKPKEVNKHVQD